MFQIKYDDITNMYFYSNGKISEWKNQLDEVQKKINTFVNMESFKGSAAGCVKSYLGEVHMSILISIGEILTEFTSRFLLYKDGYYDNIDNNLHAQLCEETLNEMLCFFSSSQLEFEEEHNYLSRTVNAVTDIMVIRAPSAFSVSDCYQGVQKDLRDLKNDTATYERTHKSNDFVHLEQMLNALRRFIAEYKAKNKQSVLRYQTGSLQNSQSFADLGEALQIAYTEREKLQEKLQEAGINEKERYAQLEAEWAEQRAKDGAFQWLAGAGAVIVGTLAIVCTAGAATPIVVAAVVVGSASIAYGASEMMEGEQEILYGMAGDAHTASWNPLRDTIFGGNQQAYDIFGTVSTTVAGIMIPVGAGYNAAKLAGASVVRAIGVEVGKDILSAGAGYVGGQVGTYWGTEWFGADVGKWVGIGTGMAAGFGASAGLTHVDKAFNLSGVYKPITITGVGEADDASRNINGLRNSKYHELTDQEILDLKNQIKEIGADESVFRFNEGTQTGYVDGKNKINVKGDVLPDPNSTHPRDLMSSKAVLAHEYYGHRAYDGTDLLPGSWNDEFRASYMAAKNAPGLSDMDRMYLVSDAIERAKEAGVTIKYNDFIREMLYGY